MLKHFRTKTYRNLAADERERTKPPTVRSVDSAAADMNLRSCLAEQNSKWTDTCKDDWSPPAGLEQCGYQPRPLAVRGRSASEPSFLSASRTVKVRVVTSSPGPSTDYTSRSSKTQPTAKDFSSSITGLQQQIKAAFGRWRKRGSPSPSQHAGLEEEEASVGSGSSGHRIREDCFDHPLNVRLSAQSQTFSHPHRLTVFPPFPSGHSTSETTTTTSPSKTCGSKSSGGANPFSFVRGLQRKHRRTEAPDFLANPSSDRVRSRTTEVGSVGSHPLAPSKSRSDHSLHRILKEDSTWTVFATLRPPSDKGSCLSKGSTAWTFGLFSDSPSHPQRRPASAKSKAASVAPSPDIVHRSFTPSSLSSSSFLCRNERRTRSLERCFQQRVHNSPSTTGSSHHHHPQQQPPPPPPPPVPSRIRSRSLEKNYQLSTTTAAAPSSVGGRLRIGGLPVSPSPTHPLLPTVRQRSNKVPTEVLATWCTFNEAFGGSRPRQLLHRPPLTVETSAPEQADIHDGQRDSPGSPGSPVFEELFLPPPHRFSGNELAVNNNNNSSSSSSSNNNAKRNSVASCCCSCGGHSVGVSCNASSKSTTPRSSPVPPPPAPAQPPPPETVLYGSREAPVLERHCVEGGEFIIAWLSHSKTPTSHPPPHRTAPSAPAPPSDMHSSGSAAAVAAAVASSSSSTATTSSNRSFINKPARGWLHSDTVIVREGITYFVRYIGCLEVNTSMKSLDFDTRSHIAKECINIVCETAGLKTIDKKRKVDRRIQRILGDAPHMEHAGSDVALTISSGCLRISTLEGSNVVACHDMPNISFASGGDPDTLDFVAYVAKDHIHGRACYVLECGGGLAQDVITTIGQAFELRFKEYLKRTPRPLNESVIDGRDVSAGATAAPPPPPWSPDDPEYYNDLPGKVPPDVGPPPVPPLPNYQAPAGTAIAGGPSTPVATTTATPSSKKSSSAAVVDLSDNLIDLNADVSQMTPRAGSVGSAASALAPAFADHDYVNGIMGSSGDFKNAAAPAPSKDPFDMHPFSAALPSALLAPNPSASVGVVQRSSGGAKHRTAATSSGPMEAQLSQEIWFHGPISRKEAEDLLKQDGDFLVRESQGSPGQYVLTGMQSGHHKHLLLVDPEGVVRTKDRTFESVSHLINFHRNNVLPIISAESVLLLKKPVARHHS